jgi:hypothetical protein
VYFFISTFDGLADESDCTCDETSEAVESFFFFSQPAMHRHIAAAAQHKAALARSFIAIPP